MSGKRFLNNLNNKKVSDLIITMNLLRVTIAALNKKNERHCCFS